MRRYAAAFLKGMMSDSRAKRVMHARAAGWKRTA